MVRKKIPIRDIRVFLGAFLVGLILLGGYLALRSTLKRLSGLPVFKVSHITVKNNRYFKPEELIRSSGIVIGKGIFDQDLRAAAARIEKSIVLKNVVVFRKLPDEVVIDVTERTPIALVNHGEIVGVDCEGVLLPHIQAEESGSLPLIKGVKGLGQQPFIAHMRKGINFLVEIGERKPELLGNISEVRVADIHRLGFCLGSGGCEILLGLNDWEEKIEALPRVLREFKGRLDKLHYLDMRFNRRVFVREK